MPKLILGFTGPMASGKGTMCAYLNEKYQAPTYRFSTALRDIADRLYLEKNRNNLQELSTVLREKFGESLLSGVVAKDAQNDNHEIITIDGIRRIEDIKELKKLPNFFLVAIDADIKTRYERIVNRNENIDDTSKTFEQFKIEQEHEAESEIVHTMEIANFQIDNNGTFEQSYNQLESIIETIKNGKN